MIAKLREAAPGLILLTLVACSRHAPSWTGEARSISDQADAFAAQGHPADGAILLERYAQSERAPGGDRLEAAVLQDAWAHAAQLQLAADHASAAASDATAGLDARETTDVYEATLHILRGRARELLGHGADAAVDYDRAAQIDELLLSEAAHGEEK